MMAVKSASSSHVRLNFDSPQVSGPLAFIWSCGWEESDLAQYRIDFLVCPHSWSLTMEHNGSRLHLNTRPRDRRKYKTLNPFRSWWLFSTVSPCLHYKPLYLYLSKSQAVLDVRGHCCQRKRLLWMLRESTDIQNKKIKRTYIHHYVNNWGHQK